jgi:hypothetical protein
MLGFVSENLPKTGAVGMNLMGGGGMLAVSFYTIIMGKHYDALVANRLPPGSDLSLYNKAASGSEMANALFEAKKAVGPAIINFTMMIPICLIVAFAGLNLYMRGRKRPDILATASAGH